MEMGVKLSASWFVGQRFFYVIKGDLEAIDFTWPGVKSGKRKEKREMVEEKGQQGACGAGGIGGGRCNSCTVTSLLATSYSDFLISPHGTQVKVEELKGHILGLYFSANWNSASQKFTPVLASLYGKLKEQGALFEIVFISFDENAASFDEYRASMPWLAVPFSDLESRKMLSGMFQIEGIPSLIFLDAEMKTTQAEGVDLVYKYGVDAFPFTTKRVEYLRKEDEEKRSKQTIVSLLSNPSTGRDFLRSHSSVKQVPVTSLVGKTVALYFSAQWCSPGFKFTPRLISVYNKIKRAMGTKDQFEVVFVSSDRDEATFELYYEVMPWLAVPFNDEKTRSLVRYFDVRRIPCLIIIGPDGKSVTGEGRSLINLYMENAYPFTQDHVRSLEKRMDEEAKSFPKFRLHSGHHHPLRLVSASSGGGPFICCECDEQGSVWAYQCITCGYEVHPRCVTEKNWAKLGGDD
ncbi:probable nucleoredoxin 2 isoform X3 [Nymphaea colorata]|uniref:probable nucleoredoxin 2 isoform X3 n=1 Tax=Nymphaea colorata TaxID=210225 RepID=UPI00129D4861|nr:probable nucleoredoxin 2 isoform X3 [Nymphaea colorata]